MKVSQTQHANALIRDMHAITERAERIAGTGDAAALEWLPPAGAWSVGQVFEHLCVANHDYIEPIRRVLTDTTALPKSSASATWGPSLMGRVIARSMEGSRKLPAPKKWKPGPTPRESVIAVFVGYQGEIVQLIEESMAYEWRRVRFHSPVSRFIRMNLGDAFTILVRHAERHFGQIDERLAAFEAVRGDGLAVSR